MSVLGTDIASHGKLTSTGDIPIVSGLDNMMQAIKNRIKTYKGTYRLMDADYGSNAKEYMGYDDNDITRKLMCLDFEVALIQDPRITHIEFWYDNGFRFNATLINGEKLENEVL